MQKSQSIVRAELKYLLYQLAKESERPGAELQELIREVINELHEDILRAQSESKKLRLVVSS